MDIFDVNKETCNRDGICAAVCPSGMIVMGKDGYPAPVAEADEVCIRCGHCVAVCPTGSFSTIYRRLPVRKAPRISWRLSG